MAKGTTPTPVTAISLTGARLTIVATVTFLTLYIALHIIRPELDPTWNTTSEYAIGRHGWIMVVAFLAQAFSYGALFVAIKSQIRTIPGRIGLGLLLLGAVAMTIGGTFIADPITTPQDALSTRGTIHGMGAGLGMLAIPLAALIVSVSLVRNNQAWSSARRPLLLTAGLSLAALVGFFAVNAAMLPSDGTYGPDVLIGVPDRVMQLVNSAWLITVAWWAIRLRSQES
jgi:hypothetical protein